MCMTRRPRTLFLVLSLAAALLPCAVPASAEEQTIQNGMDNGSIRIAVTDAGTMAVWRFDGTVWIKQSFGPYSKHSVLFLDGGDSSMRFSTGRWLPAWTAGSNGTNAGNDTITTAFLADGGNVRITQSTSVTAGPYYRMQWRIENIGASTYEDVRFAHGEDTYLAGHDSGEGRFDNALKMVYVTNAAAGVADMMGIYASAGTPFTHFFQGHYIVNYTRMAEWTLDNTVDPVNLDAGYSLGWTRDSFAPGQAWTIVAYEKFTRSVGVQIVAPAEQEGVRGDAPAYAFRVRNLDAATADIGLSAASAGGWTTSVRDGSGAPLPGVHLAGGAETVVYVRVEVPADAVIGSPDLVTLTATFGAAETSADSTATTVIEEHAVPEEPGGTPAFRSGGMGSGSCGIVVGMDGKEAPGPAAEAGLMALYLAILLAPVGFLKLRLAKRQEGPPTGRPSVSG